MLPKKTDGSDELIDGGTIKKATYSLGVRYIEGETLYLYHDDVIELFFKIA